MKSGTTSLHYLLGSHQRVFIPRKEIFFFTIDDYEQHPGFFRGPMGSWVDRDYERQFDEYFAWYASFFEEAADGQLVGEDAPTYMASATAPARIKALLPRCKLIFMLRCPVRRAYSQYWHLVASGRAFHSFEKTVRYHPGNLLQRGLYRSHVEAFSRHFPASQLKFVIFERFVRDPQTVANELAEFLDLSCGLDLSTTKTQRNAAQMPRFFRLQLAYNRLFPQLATAHYVRKHLPGAARPAHKGLLLTMDKWFKRLNVVQKPYPTMRTRTRAFLESFYARENRGLSELIGTNVSEEWKYKA